MRWLLCLSVNMGLPVSGFGQVNPAETTSPSNGVVAHAQIRSEVDRLFHTLREKGRARRNFQERSKA
jgi:hypothetical protein